MTQPLALVLYERLLPGTQLVNRLQDLGYRVLTVAGDALKSTAEKERPMLALVDLAARRIRVPELIADLRANPATSHLPVIAFANDQDAKREEAARKAGATLVVNEAAMLDHLDQFLEQALQLD